MPDAYADLARNLVGQLSPAQTSFISTYLDKDFQTKKQKAQDEFNTACAKFGIQLTQLSDAETLLESGARTKDDLQFAEQVKARSRAVLNSLGEKTKNHKEALAKITKATAALVPITKDANDYLFGVKLEGRDIGAEGAIRAEYLRANLRRNELTSAFALAVEGVAETFRQSAPNEPFAPEAKKVFEKAFAGYQTEVNAILVMARDTTKTAADAQEASAAVIKKMDDTMRVQVGALNTFGKSPEFLTFCADAKLKGEVLGNLSKAAASIELLDRWEATGRDAIATEHERIEGLIDTVFADRAGIKPSEVTAHEAAQKTLATAAAKLVTDAAALLRTTTDAFNLLRTQLLQRLVALETTAAKLAKSMGKQGVHMLDALASARLAVDGLNGNNAGALAMAGKLLDAAKVMVDAGAAYKVTNTEIETALKEATKTASGLTKPVNPKWEAATALGTELATFKTEWKTKEISAAKTEVLALKAKADAMATENTAIIERRRKIDEIIKMADAQLVALDLAFKDLVKNSPAAGRDYGGELMKEIDVCRSWNATKADLDFYSTIELKLQAATMAIAAKLNDIREIGKLTPDKAMLEAFEAKRLHDAEMERLKSTDKDGKGPDPDEVLKAKEAYDKKIAFLNTREDLIAESNKADLARQKDEQDKLDFLEQSKALETEIEKEQKASGPKDPFKAYEAEVKRHLDRLKTSREMIRKKDPGLTGAAAMAELGLMKQALDSIRQRGAKSEKSKLGEIKPDWEDAVGVFVKAASKLMTSIEAFETAQDVTPAVSSQINNALSRIIGQMNAHNFTRPAADLSDPAADDAKRRAAREMALAEVRRLRKLVFEDPLIQKCVLNPFGVGIGGPTQYRLEEIELNVLRGV